MWQVASPRQTDYTEDAGFSGEFQKFLTGDDREEVLRKWSEENHREIWWDRDVPFARIPPYSDPNIRPNVLLFDEPYGNRLLWVDDFIREKKPGIVLVIGCSGTVSVLYRLLESCLHANPDCGVININSFESCIGLDHIDIRLPAAEALTRLSESLATAGSGSGSE